MKRGILLIIALIVLGSAAGYLWNQNAMRVASSVDWEKELPAVKSALISAFPDITIEEVTTISIYEQADLTNDGLREALVTMGTGGAYTDFLTLVTKKENTIQAARFTDANGKISPLTFLAGSSVLNGSDVAMWPAQNAIYQGSWSFDEKGVFTHCEVQAYQWEEESGTFAFRTSLSDELETDFCSKL